MVLPMISTRDQDHIRSWNETLSADIQLDLIVTKDARSRALAEFCDALVGLARRVCVMKDEGGAEELPAIEIAGSVRYHAVPLGSELDPFLEAVSLFHNQVHSPVNSQGKSAAASLIERLADVRLPADLHLYVAQQCPYCPVATRQILSLAAANEWIKVAVVDSTLFRETAEAASVRSVPTLVLDDHFRWTGRLELDEVMEAITNRDPAGLSAASLQGMLKEGDAPRVATMMVEQGLIFPALLDLLTHEKLFIRLGAMVAMEEVEQKNRALAAQIIEPLWKRFEHVEHAVQGDLLYVFGEVGDATLAPRLEQIVRGDYPADVKEAAKEALEKVGLEISDLDGRAGQYHAGA